MTSCWRACGSMMLAVLVAMPLAGAATTPSAAVPVSLPNASAPPIVPPVTASVTATAIAPTVVPAPFAMDKAYSADMDVALKNGMRLRGRVYMDSDKLRSEMTMNGMDMAFIVRKDQMKIYNLLLNQKMAMVMDFDPSKLKGNEAAAFGPEGKFELMGPDTVDGVPCTKYRVTSDKSGTPMFFWLDTVHKVPVAMSSPDGTFCAKWTNYKQGPQDATLFEVPQDFNMMPMPSGMGMPGTGGGGAP